MAKKKQESEGYYKTINATVKNNLPYCGECGTLLDGGTIDYKEIIHGGETYVSFLKFCSNPDCHCKNLYYAQIGMNKTKRYSFTEDIKEIKDENIKGGDFDDTSLQD